jgi:glycosyltransferase involved in cell wall biosynthesis
MDENRPPTSSGPRGSSDGRPRRRRNGQHPRARSSSTAATIVVPAYNEAENLPLLFEKFAEQFARQALTGEVILVDDGSTDATHDVARAGAAQYRWLRVRHHGRNRGLTAALKTGFDHAHFDILVFWPADLQYMPADIPRLLGRFSEGYDVVTGWKQGRYGIKRMVSLVYNLASRMLFRVKVHDLNSVKAFKVEVLKSIPWRKDWHRYMVVWAADQGFRIGEEKVKLYPRFRGKTKFSIWRIPVGVLDLLAVKFQMSFLRKPLLFFGTWGFVLIGLGFLVGLVALYLRFALHEGYRPLLYLVMLCETIGVMLFAIGFLAEAIVDLGERMQSQIEELRPRAPRTEPSSPRPERGRPRRRPERPAAQPPPGPPLPAPTPPEPS